MITRPRLAACPAGFLRLGRSCHSPFSGDPIADGPSVKSMAERCQERPFIRQKRDIAT
jgi:hypothetical protein